MWEIMTVGNFQMSLDFEFGGEIGGDLSALDYFGVPVEIAAFGIAAAAAVVVGSVGLNLLAVSVAIELDYYRSSAFQVKDEPCIAKRD